MTADAGEITPDAAVGFIGLGRMGGPMALRLAEAGYRVRGYDVRKPARDEWAAQAPRAAAADSLAAAAEGAAAVILMLPDSSVVTDVLVGRRLLAALPAGTMVVDMSASEPWVTRELAAEAGRHEVTLMDAPVSGGVSGAARGSLTIMAGGTSGAVRRVRALLDVLGSRITHVGDVGAGHAVKALNNLLSAAHLLATSEAMTVAARFGLDIPVVLEAINVSTGRSGSTEDTWPEFVLPGTFDSGFPLRLLLEDVRIALGMAESTGTRARLSEAAEGQWADAAAALPADADHTEVARWLDPGR